ncbi:hypothetical protein [Streptomyces sp. NRRL S-920]|uniref:hypothetical protein n=1 Tax=Streptomyces sp. NRRL S-920 TaxID=1463921 RepID=UPI000AC8FF1A|nr:hypothetical protein [Streptomyces sp. NRRL S-920]
MHMTYRSIRHPLALLRGRDELSHAAYAKLIADTHAELGFGTMAARREKVARWESGKITPELSAQYAMAHVHGVPRTDVVRLGWPEWLYVATGHASLLQQPWSCDEALVALEGIARSSPEPDGRDDAIPACEQSIRSLTTAWLNAAAPLDLPDRRGLRLSASAVSSLELRRLEGRKLFDALGSTGTRILADSWLLLLCDLTRNASYDRATGARLLALTADAACYSGRLAFDLGDQRRAQSAVMAALRAASAAQDNRLGAWALTQFAMQRLHYGEVQTALTLLDAAQHACRRSRYSPRLASLIHVLRGRAYAEQGEHRASAREMDIARTLHSPALHDDDPDCLEWFTGEAIQFHAGAAHFSLNEMGPTVDHLLPLLDADPAGGSPVEGQNAALCNGFLARAQLACGDTDQALERALRTAEFLFHSSSVAVAKQWQLLRAELAERSGTPAVRALLEEPLPA